MTATAPDISPASKAVAEFEQRQRANLIAEHGQILSEIQRRLSRLQRQASELIDINNRMWAKRGIEMRFDPLDESIVLSVGGVERRLKFERADPNIPIAAGASTGTSAYHAGNSDNADEEEQVLRLELEEKIESFYQSAHRILKLFRRIPSLERIKSPAVTRVRNNLIEHPSDGSLYSFGVGTTGPRVKPMYQGTQEFDDDGLVPNTAEFVAAIVKGCAECAS
jgi:hypothetical protein